MKKDRFYAETGTTDELVYKSAIAFAFEYARQDVNIKKIVLLIGTKQNTGWFELLFGKDNVKHLFSGVKNENGPLLKIETKRTYQGGRDSSEIVITCGLDSIDIYEIDDYSSIAAIIVIPWLINGISKWLQTWSPIEFRTGKSYAAVQSNRPNCIVRMAMDDLSTINMSDGRVTHPLDKDRMKTTIRSLHKYEPSLNGSALLKYLVSELGWPIHVADEIERLIDTLQGGKSFKGGEMTGLQNYYKRWAEKCKENQ
ncbi:MAG: hypothetical protein EOO46_21865 [Flavobacterium sp.]|nr:MAG: hypothetical protein EOO46_21865 [Flavobacterium sp.]